MAYLVRVFDSIPTLTMMVILLILLFIINVIIINVIHIAGPIV